MVDLCALSEMALPCRHSSVSAADKEGPATHEAWGIHSPALRRGTGQPLCSSEVQLQIPSEMALLPRGCRGGPGEEEKFRPLPNCR